MTDDLAAPASRLDETPEAAAPSAAAGLSSPGEIPHCCVETISQHVRFNPMMVCSQCKRIIKCFQEERAYQNYLTFCRSRRRPVLIGLVGEHLTVVFNSYDSSYTR